jgi:Uma2 family endonuclease
MAATLTRKRFQLMEFLELAEELKLAGSWEWHELIGGELVVHSSPRDPHMSAELRVIDLLIAAEDAGYGRAGGDRMVALDYPQRGLVAEDVVKPDAFFVTTEREAILDAGEDGPPCVVGAPDLVVEVLSPTTAKLDQPGGDKFRAYERAGVRYYWLLDTNARTVRQFELRQRRLVQVALLEHGDTVACPLFPGVKTAVARIFR